MATTDIPGRLADKASDWLNPILVKEARQALKSRQFIATFLLLLGVSWLASMLTIIAVSGENLSTSGKKLFWWYALVLSVAIFIVVPFTAFRSLQTERDQHTYEVLSVTTLKPRQILLGKLGSALVQMFIYYSALTPFIAFTYLLRGIDVPTIAYILLVGFIASVVVSLLALTLSTFASQRQWQVLLTLLVLGGLLTVMILASLAVSEFLRNAIPFQDPKFWFINAAILSIAVGYSLLVEQIAVAQLTFDADNRSTGVRIVTSVLVALWILCPVVAWLWFGGTSPIADEIIVVCAIQLGVIGLFFVTEPEALSRRLHRNMSRMKLRRLPALLYYPGGSRGLFYCLAHIAVALAILYATVRAFPPSTGSQTMDRAEMLSMYLIVYLGGSAALSRWGRNVWSEFRPAHARVICWALAVVLMLVPNVMELADTLKWARPWLQVLNPFDMDHVRQGDGFYLLIAGATIALLVNIPAMLRSARETLGGNVQPAETHSMSVTIPTPAASAAQASS